MAFREVYDIPGNPFNIFGAEIGSFERMKQWMKGRKQADENMPERGFENCPPMIERAKQQAFQYFADPDIGVISIVGYHGLPKGYLGIPGGLGRCRTAKRIAKAAMDSHLFNITIWVSLPQKDWSVSKVQSVIANRLKIDCGNYDDEEEMLNWDEKRVGVRIFDSLEKQRFLLILEDPPLEFIKLESLGVPTPNLKNATKVLIVTRSLEEAQKVMKTEESITISLRTFEDSIKLVKEECMDVADSLRFTNGHLSEDSILAFLKCSCLFGSNGVSGDYIKYSWLGEGLIGDGNNQHLDIVAVWKIGEQLLTEFQSRGLIESDDKGYYKVVVFNNHPFFVKRLLGSTRIYTEEEDDELEGDDIDWISFARSPRIERLGHTSPRCPKASILVLHGCDQLKEEIPDDFFSHMQGLRVLDLSGCTTLSSLPTSLSLNYNLKVLNLANCNKFNIFPPPIQTLDNLLLLDLSGTSVRHIPPSAFERLHDLQQLNLSNATSLVSLLSSLSHCVSLKSLNLSGCKALEDISRVSFGPILPNLQFLDLSRTTQLIHLSLKDHPSLEELELEGVTSLEVLDLSGTKIKRFPHEICTQGSALKCLYLLGTKHLCQVYWDKIKQPPKELLNWNEFSSNEQNQQHQHEEDGVGKAFISLRSGNVFVGEYTSVYDFFKCFSQFHVTISPCSEEGREGKDVVFQREHFPYRDIYNYESSSSFFSSHSSTNPAQHFTHFMSTNRDRRYLEINGGNISFPEGLKGVLQSTQFLSLCNNNSIVHLEEFVIYYMSRVEACWIERCHGMKIVFHEGDVSSLKNLWVSNLAKLTTMCKGSFQEGSFRNLKHIRLEYCPKLVKIFSLSGGSRYGIPTLGNLEMLEIRFCVRLEEVFEEGTIKSGEDGICLPRLHTLCLWELASLKRIFGEPKLYLGGLEKVNVRGCPMLQKLPLHFADDVCQENDPNIEMKSESIGVVGPHAMERRRQHVHQEPHQFH